MERNLGSEPFKPPWLPPEQFPGQLQLFDALGWFALNGVDYEAAEEDDDEESWSAGK